MSRRLILAAVVLGAQPACAAQYCVTCAGPAAEYACTITDSSGAMPDAAQKLLCIKELAKSGGHASCSVERNSNTECRGAAREIAAPAEPATVTEVPKQAAPATPEAAGNEAAQAPADESSNASGVEEKSALDKAGSAITGAAKSTWKCLSSAFSDC